LAVGVRHFVALRLLLGCLSGEVAVWASQKME